LPLLTMRFTQETKEDFLAGALPVHEGVGHSVSDDEDTRVQQRECKC
jgi:hypothetical protein